MRVARHMVCAMRIEVMLATIDFNDQPAFETDKIHNEGADWLLAAKSHRGDLTASESLPEMLFCFREVAAQFSRAFGVHPPIPAFPSKRDEVMWAA